MVRPRANNAEILPGWFACAFLSKHEEKSKQEPNRLLKPGIQDWPGVPTFRPIRDTDRVHAGRDKQTILLQTH